MEKNYEQHTSAIGSLRSILQSYPFSVGIFREILQNSDDAGASKQIFVLDLRNHPVVSLNHANLASTQGPALLAYNNALFKEADWESLKHAFESSKSDDSSKIGKYGIGFRSVYHITDCPQILSGSFLTISDPLKTFTDTYGKRINLLQSFNTHRDQLSSFDWFLNHGWKDTTFEGTIIRCPLRSIVSKISAKIVRADEISQLFQDFITEEIDISLLFLQNLKSIEIYEVDEQGVSTCVATSAISRSESSACGDGNKTYKSFITKNCQGREHEKVWRLLHCPFPQEEAVAHLAKRQINNPSSTLREHKLAPNVSLAVPLTITTQAETGGRLFTFLPLPLKTGFPAHVHALFALTQSRQHLRNSRETGIVSQAADHVVIEWNKLLFEEFIPRAWRILLEVLVRVHGIVDVFRAWPNKQPITLSGDTIYWQSLPTRVLHFVVSSGSPVWPVYSLQKDSPTEYKVLDELMTSQPSIRESVLRSLTMMGLELTRPPVYLVEEIKKLVDSRYVILTPEAAHDALLRQVPARLTDIPRDDTFVVLEYLLSTDNVLNIVGLPFVKTASGCVAALTSLSSQPPKTYIMLDRGEFNVFGSCDDDSIIALKDLPSHVAKCLQSRGPKFINVENLGSEQIVEYLTLYPNRLGLQRVVQWLSIFWVWMSTYSDRTDLYLKIKHLSLLPTTHGLKTAESFLFKSRGEHPLNIQHLSSLGVVFLDAGVTDAAQAVIASHGLLKIINQDIHTLLDSLPSDPSTLSLDKGASLFILRFISARASAACASHGPFNKEQIQRLKKLPIYPVFVSSDTSPIHNWTSIPDGYSIRTISRPSFIPVIERIVFVEAQLLTFSLLGYLQPDYSSPLSDVQFLALTFEHFTAQSTSLQAAVLQHLVHRQRHLPPSLLSSLVEIPFVVSIDGLKRKPGEVVDPSSPIACLFEGDSARQVRTVNGSEQAIVGSLHSMRLMQHTLTIPMIEERIKFISANHSSSTSIKLSRSLLAVIQSTHFDCSGLTLVPGQKWLPTDRGLCVPEECRDGERNRPVLFDEVLGVLEQGIQIPHSLRSAFDWDRPIETATIIKQFSQVLTKIQVDDTHEKVVAIIKELSGRDCSDSDLVTLRSITAERKWVPTSTGQLARTVDAVFSPIAEAGFEQILYINTKAREFLSDLGCSEEPSQNAILMKLNALSNTILDAVSVKVAVNLLNILPPAMSDADSEHWHAALWIPDERCILRPHSEIYFNDIAERASLIPAENHFIAHDLVDDTLARKLNLARLGLKFVDLNVPGVDMGEKPLTTVRNTLRQYTEQQFVTEFVANACDANATKLTLLVNDFCSNSGENTCLLSPTMQKFFNCPSLVVYNNAKFSDKDFTGICQTSIGGKESKSDTIGQFGLGALTMFHITELAVIVSNADVLFLNPSKEYLPTSDRAALKISLNHIRQFYPDHLSSIDGLFGFDASESNSDPYEGTIFILPLRIPSHCVSERASDTTWTASDIQQKILEPFERVASNCLLFTKIEEFCSVFRNADGTETVSWSTRAERIQELVEEDSGFSTSIVTLSHISASGARSSYWKTASATVASAQIPPKLLSALAKQYRLRLPPIIGLAASLDDLSPKTELFNFFSTLPLAIKTTLPVHIMASFVLSPDRRQIRLDEFNNPETEYNRWLLSSVIPPLYLFLLESFSSGDNARWWPGRLPHTLEPMAQILVNAFFSVHLKKTERHVFRSMFNISSCLTKKDCVLFDGEHCVKKVLSLLRSHKLVKLPKFITRRAADESGIAIVDPVFLRNEILPNPFAITSVLNFTELEKLIGYLAGKGVADRATEEDSTQVDIANLIDLPLLPLANGNFVTLQGKGYPTSYFVWTSHGTPPRLVFPLDRLVHPEFNPKSVLKMGLNVSLLNSDVVKAFIKDRLPQSPIIEDAAQETIEWIQDFWNEYPFLDSAPLQAADISEFPLVSTIRPGCFVSLEGCSSGSTCIFRGNSQEQLWDCLVDLGITVVQADNQSIPESLTYIFNSRIDDFPESKLERILSAMNVESPTVSERFSNLEADSQWIFASWARPQIRHFVGDLLRVAQELPIWEVARPGEDSELRAASEILMLPEGLSTEIAARFFDGFVAEWGNLKYLNGPKLTFAELEDYLDLPAVLGPSDMLPYKELLTIWIAHLPFGYGRPLPVPNSYGDIIQSDMLYAREELFEAAFGVDSVDIPAIEFQDLENALYGYGLQGTNGLDMTMFTACAEATHRIGEDEDRAHRAEIVFRAYCLDLPLHVGQDAQCSWSNLDHLRFIPRNMGSVRRLEHHEDRRMELDIPQHLQDLPDVVSPNELVRKEFESIAWTQRASFSVQPGHRILMVNPGLGMPHITEVISHLSVLSSFPVQSQPQRKIIIHDMVETLKWLNENVADSENILYELRYDNIFLNVDDPSAEAWIWTNANELAFEAEDTDNGIRCVRRFLLPYDKLLRAAGVVQVFHPQCPMSDINDSESATLRSIRAGFNDLRRKGLWTDVVFVTSDDDSDDTDIVPSLVAHRSYLTVFSDYFSDMFCGEFREANDASSSKPIRFRVKRAEGDYHSADCVQLLLDYMYTGDEPLEDSSLELLLEAVELSGYWRLEHFFEEVQRIIVKRRLMTPLTLDCIRETAERAKAEVLLRQGQEYEEKNAAYIQKFRSPVVPT